MQKNPSNISVRVISNFSNRFSLFLPVWLAILSFLPVNVSASNTTAPYAEYTIDLKPGLQELDVRVCFSGSPPAYLFSKSETARENIITMWLGDGNKGQVDLDHQRIDMKELEEGDCIHYRAGIDFTTDTDNRFRRLHANLQLNNITLQPSSWLWLPEQSPATASIQLIFRHPRNYAVSAPWKLLSRSVTETRYELGQSLFDWRALIALGEFTIENVHVPGADLRLAILKGNPPAEIADIRKWIEQGALSITRAYGRFPVPSPQIMVVPLGATDRGPVPWGQVLRGGGAAAQLYIDQTRPIEEHIHDWTLIHELCHLLHPYLGDEGAWLAEGLATYYQNLLQVRGGPLPPEQAWQKLHDGFQRGLKQTREGITLEAASKKRNRRTFMRIYWSGAAISLLADLSLRAQGKSLDYVMSEFQRCCLPADAPWDPRKFMVRLDELAGSSIFSSLFDAYNQSDRFPELDDAYKTLGIIITDGKVGFTDDPGAADLRDSIMSETVNSEQIGNG